MPNVKERGNTHIKEGPLKSRTEKCRATKAARRRSLKALEAKDFKSLTPDSLGRSDPQKRNAQNNNSGSAHAHDARKDKDLGKDKKRRGMQVVNI